MFNLILSVICSLCIANLIKFFQKSSEINFLMIFLGNYVMASIFSFIQNKQNYTIILSWDILLAIISGVFFLLCFFVYQKNIKENGISLSVSMMRLALIIPTTLSLILFKEFLPLYKYGAIFLIIISIVLLTRFDHKIKLFWLIMLFILSGIIDFAMKIFESYGKNSISSFLLILFLSAFLANLTIVFYKKIKFRFQDIVYGLIIGIPNQLTSLFFLKALTQMPATIAYPLHASSIVVFSIASDILIWKQKIKTKHALIYSLMIGCIIVLNIGR